MTSSDWPGIRKLSRVGIRIETVNGAHFYEWCVNHP
jgi:hypothetical protein